METLGIAPDELCDVPLIDPVMLNEKARSEASLSFKEKYPLIYDNYNLCEKRLMTIYLRLKGNPELLKQYGNIVTAQKELQLTPGNSNTG